MSGVIAFFVPLLPLAFHFVWGPHEEGAQINRRQADGFPFLAPPPQAGAVYSSNSSMRLGATFRNNCAKLGIFRFTNETVRFFL